MGNQLPDSVLRSMVSTFEHQKGTLAERLLAALLAGQSAGGQIQGKQSAALVVKGAFNEWYNNIDLRADNAKDPFGELTGLLRYHYGRIRLNQAIYAINMGNISFGKARLIEAEQMIKGWNGIQGRLALAYLLLNENTKAVTIIRAALEENPKMERKFTCLLPAERSTRYERFD